MLEVFEFFFSMLGSVVSFIFNLNIFTIGTSSISLGVFFIFFVLIGFIIFVIFNSVLKKGGDK